jgi:hypothetical protein
LKPKSANKVKPNAAPATGARWQPAAVAVCRLALTVWIWAMGMNIRVHPAAAGLDHSGSFTFNYAHAHGMVFGRDLAFTYGPLSFLTIPMPLGRNLEAGFRFQFVVWMIFAAVTAWLIFGRRVPLAGAAICAIGLFLGSGAFRLFGYAGPDMFLVYVGLILLGGALAGRRWMLWYAGAAAICTLVFFVKFSSAATLGGAMAIFTAALYATDRAKAWRATLILAATPVMILIVHVVFYGSPAYLWRYVRVSIEMGSAYGVAMSEGSDMQALRMAILLMTVWLGGSAVLWWRRIPSRPLALACIGPLFLEFKHSFAREAGHVEIFFFFVALLAGLVALFTEIRRTDRWYVTAALAAVAGCWYWQEPGRARELMYPIAPFANLRSLRDAVNLPELRRSMEAMSTQLLGPDRLPPELLARVGRAPIAIFPMECSYAGINPIQMRPFPILQAYQAYTSYLDAWNAQFLDDPQSAPAFILFDWDTVDGRHPLLDAPATAVSMFRQYEFDGMYGRHLLLRKRAQPRFGTLRLLDRRDVPLAQPLRFPANEHPLAARIFLKWNPRGRLLKFFFRIPEIRLVAWTSQGRALNVRVPPDVLADGVPSFLPIDMNATRALFGGSSPGRIDALLVGGPGARYLEPVAHVEIYSVPGIVMPPAPSPLPDLSTLRPLGSIDSWRMEMLNQTEAGAFAQVTVPGDLGYVRLKGWAVVQGDVAGGVVVELDGKPYPADYGEPRPDVGALFHAPGPLNCGFEWSVPAADLGKDWHVLGVKILNRERTGYYEGSRGLRFKME